MLRNTVSLIVTSEDLISKAQDIWSCLPVGRYSMKRELGICSWYGVRKVGVSPPPPFSP